MLRKDFIICKTRNLLDEFMTPIIADADKPRQKFLRQAVAAILLSGSLIVTEFASWIHDDCTDIFHRLKRLLNHLVSTSDKTNRCYLQADKNKRQQRSPHTNK